MSKFWLPTFVFIVISAIFTWTVFMTARSEASVARACVSAPLCAYLSCRIHQVGLQGDTDHH